MELQPDGAMYFKDMIEVSGEGSELEIAAADGKSRTIAGGRGGSKIIVTDGGKFTVARAAYCWSGFARNVLIQVSNGGQIKMGSTVYCGANGNAECGNRHNRIEVLSGGSFTVNNGTFYFGDGFHSGQSLVVSNGTFQSADFKLGNDVASSNNIVVIQGTNAVFTPYMGTKTWAMFTAPFCEYRVELGARYAPPSSYFGGSAKVGHSTLRVRNGGILDVQSELRTSINGSVHTISGDSYSHGIVAASNNCIIAENGGIVTGKTINVGGRACSLRVDDSSVSLTNTADSLVIGYDNKFGGAGTNCVLEIAGSCPSVRLSGNLKFQYVSDLKFELPADGYEANAKPVVAEGAVSIGSPCRLVFTGAAEMLASHTAADKNGEYVLIENPQAKTFVSDAVVEAAQAELAEVGSDLKLFKRVLDSRNQLVLRVKGYHPGLMIIVK